MENRNGYFVSVQLPEEIVLEATMEGKCFGGEWVAVLHLLINGERKALLAVKNFSTPLRALLFGDAQVKMGEWIDTYGNSINPMSMMVMHCDGLVAMQVPKEVYRVSADET